MEQKFSLTTQDDTILANNHPVFSASASSDKHGQFPATRHWSSSTSRETQDVQVLYTLIHHESQGQEQGQEQSRRQDLEITLLDKYGHLAMSDPLLITVIREAGPMQSQSNLEKPGETPIKSVIITTRSQNSHTPKTKSKTSHPRPPKAPYRPYRGPHAIPHLIRPVLLPMLLGIFVGFLACVVIFIAGRVFRGHLDEWELRERRNGREYEPEGDALVGEC